MHGANLKSEGLVSFFLFLLFGHLSKLTIGRKHHEFSHLSFSNSEIFFLYLLKKKMQRDHFLLITQSSVENSVGK